MKGRLEQLRSRLPANNQQGFTLIELLVVVSILGILAAVVTLSLVGIQNYANGQAQKQDLATVQAAFDTEIQQFNLDPKTACGGFTDSGNTTNAAGLPANQGGSVPSLVPTYIHNDSKKWTYWCSNANSGTLSSQ